MLLSLVGLTAAHRHDLHGMFRGRAWHWAGALAVTALLAFPIALNTILHWPGQFGNYLGYMRNVSAYHLIHHSLAFSVGYTLRYWWPGAPASIADIGGAYVAGVVPHGQLAPIPALVACHGWPDDRAVRLLCADCRR